MKYVIDKDIDDIIQIYPEIFILPFQAEEYNKKIKKGYEIFPVKFLNDGKLIGFCFVIDKHINSSLHCWIGGVLPEHRKTGVFGDFIEWVIDYACENKYARVTLNTDNNKPDIIRMLVKYGFDINNIEETKYGDGKRIMFIHDIYPRRKMRLSITDRCNMNCFFCHYEGNFSPYISSISLSAIEQLLIQAQKMNFSEITITGGEPLTYFEGVLSILSNCNKWIHRPKIKICTNGVFLDDHKLQMVECYKGELEFNISLHATNSAILSKIVGINITFAEYNRIFDSLNKYNIKFRVNCVILKGVNDDDQSLISFFDYALSSNIESVHLLELLVSREQTNLLLYYESIDEIEEKIKALAPYFKVEPWQKTEKKRSFLLHRNNRCIKVVLFRLSCRCGCNNCFKENDVKIGADMLLHPCYIEHEANCGNAVMNLKKAVENRDDFMRTHKSDYSDEMLYWGE